MITLISRGKELLRALNVSLLKNDFAFYIIKYYNFGIREKYLRNFFIGIEI